MRDKFGRFTKGHSKPTNAYKYEKGYIQNKKHRKHLKEGIIKSYQNGRVPSYPMLGRKHSEETKLKISESRKGKNTGISHRLWKNGISGKNSNIRTSKEYQQWRRDVFIRDHFTCQDCGHRFINIIAHHIKSFAEYKKLWFDVNNGKTLCRACHAKLHHLKTGAYIGEIHR